MIWIEFEKIRKSWGVTFDDFSINKVRSENFFLKINSRGGTCLANSRKKTSHHATLHGK